LGILLYQSIINLFLGIIDSAMKTTFLALSLFIVFNCPISVSANEKVADSRNSPPLTPSKSIEQLCVNIGQKLGSVDKQDCLKQELTSDGVTSIEGYPLAYKVYPPLAEKQPLGKVLLMGGIHGDEYSAISIMFKWMDKLNKYHSGLFHWMVIPNLNPDGLLQKKSRRQNARGVDLNRNFPSKNWDELALKYWKERTYKNPRRYPGPTSLSEPETIWFTETITRFSPDVIIAVHAPHRLVDFDGPINAPKRLGNLQLRLLGTYPGSLGNYAGVDLNIPVVTVELASAGIMPTETEISRMWVDIIRWLRKEIPQR
jgi:murein peptide amidase A